MAQKWADCLHHPRRLGVPNVSDQGTKSEVAHMWADWLHPPYRRAAVRGVRNASERGTKTEVAHNWADCLHHPCHLGGSQHFRACDDIRTGQKGGGLARLDLPLGGLPRIETSKQKAEARSANHGVVAFVFVCSSVKIELLDARFMANRHLREGEELTQAAQGGCILLCCSHSPAHWTDTFRMLCFITTLRNFTAYHIASKTNL